MAIETLRGRDLSIEQATRAADSIRADHAVEISRRAAPTHVASGVETANFVRGQAREARKRPNPLWSIMVRSFEREWATPWEYMDTMQRGIIRVMYRREKVEAAKPKPSRPVPEPVRRGPWDPAPSFGGK